MAGRLVSFFMESDLRKGHDGLTKTAKKNGVDVTTLQPGEFVIFINRKVSAFKMYGHGESILYYRPKGGRLELKTIQHIPSVFKAGRLDYNEALSKVFEKYERFKPLRAARKASDAKGV